MKITIRVRPNAKVTKCTGWVGDNVFIIALHAPPVDGRANNELIAFLSDKLGVAKSTITLIRGAGSREKIVEVPDAIDVRKLCT